MHRIAADDDHLDGAAGCRQRRVMRSQGADCTLGLVFRLDKDERRKGRLDPGFLCLLTSQRRRQRRSQTGHDRHRARG